MRDLVFIVLCLASIAWLEDKDHIALALVALAVLMTSQWVR